MTGQQRQHRNVGGALVGLTIVLLGVTLLLDRAGVIDGFDYASVWPLVVITIGLVKLSHTRDDGRREGGWWVFFGVWMLLNEMHVLRVRESWPLFLVAIGVSMIWKELDRRPRTHERVE